MTGLRNVLTVVWLQIHKYAYTGDMYMEFLTSLIGSGLVSFESAMFFAMGLLGMLAHYGKKRIKGQTKVSLKDYFGKNHPLSSVGTFVTFAGAMTGMTLGFDIALLDVWIVAILGITCGWTIDSGVNKVTEEQ